MASHWPMYSFYVHQEINSLWSEDYRGHTGCTPWMLSTPYSVKLLSSILWTEAFRKKRNCSQPWSTEKGHSFLQRFSGVQKSAPFSHGTEHTQSGIIKTMPQSEFRLKHTFYKSVNSKLNKKNHTHTHTHTTCWYTVHYLVSKFLNSIYWITRLNRQEVTEPQDTLVHSINFHNPIERFSFKDSYE
jgi:hypothetical protein